MSSIRKKRSSSTTSRRTSPRRRCLEFRRFVSRALSSVSVSCVSSAVYEGSTLLAPSFSGDREGRRTMQQVHDGQCGLCTHFGESHSRAEKLVQIRVSH